MGQKYLLTSKDTIPFQNPYSIVLKRIQNVMKGEAEKAGFNDPDNVVKYIKSHRKIKKSAIFRDNYAGIFCFTLS